MAMANAQLRAVVASLRGLYAADEHRGMADGELLAAFLSRHDQTAFAALVQRHGPMVLGVCRRLLHQAEDAEDYFQATFLLLSRQAVSIRKCESLGSWLYGVAYRMATNSRRAAARRRAHEARSAKAASSNPTWEAAWREVQAVLDEEIQRLPAAGREAFILCCLEGKACADVARELGLKEGTVWSRVARAREHLRTRLARRGISLALVLAAGALPDNTMRAAVPALLLQTTVQAAAGLAPPAGGVAALVDWGVKSMILTKSKVIATALFVVGLFVAGAGALAHQQGAREAALPSSQKAPPPVKDMENAEPKETQVLADRHGDPLAPGALARMGTVRFRHGDGVWRLAYSPDSKLLASAGWGKTVSVWESDSGKLIRNIPSDPRAAYAGLTFSNGGKTLLTPGVSREDDRLHFWDVATGKELRSLRLDEWRLYIELSPDGKVLVTAPFKGKVVSVYDPEKGAEVCKLAAGGVIGLALSSDGKTVAAVGEDNFVRVWDTATGKELKKIATSITFQDGSIAPVVLSPDGKMVAAALADEVIRLWDVSTGKEQGVLKVQGGKKDAKVLALAFSPDGKTLASGGMDNTVRLWEVAAAKELRSMTGHQSWIQTVAFAPDGKTLASGSQDNMIRRWDVATGKEIAPLGGHDYWVFSTAFSPDGKLLATGAGDGTIRLWKADTGEELRKIESGQDWVMTMAFSPDGKILASGTWYDGAIRLWDVATGKETRRLKGHEHSVAQVVFSADGKLLASVGKDRDEVARLWDVSSGKELARLEGHKGGATSVAFAPDGKTLVTTDDEGQLRVWDIATTKVLFRFRVETSPLAIAISPDARFLAVAGQVEGSTLEQLGEALQLWDLATGKKVRQFLRVPIQEKRQVWAQAGGAKPVKVSESPGPRKVNAVAFTSDGRNLISAEHDGAVVVWEALTGQVRRELTGHQAEVMGLAVTVDGKKAASVSTDLTALVWDVTGLLRDKPPVARLSAERLDQLWDALNEQDAQKGQPSRSRTHGQPRADRRAPPEKTAGRSQNRRKTPGTTHWRFGQQLF